MKVHFISKTGTGRWAAILTAMFIVFLVLKVSMLPYVPRIPLPMPLIALLGFVGFILGIVAAVKDHDRSVTTILTLVVGTLLTIWVAAEILFPH